MQIATGEQPKYDENTRFVLLFVDFNYLFRLAVYFAHSPIIIMAHVIYINW